MQILKYKDYEGSAELDVERGVCRGKILFIDDLVTYESDTIKGLQKQFEEAVDDYVETCAQVGKAPQKACKGLFNVRVSPALHREANRRAIVDGSTLNDVVRQALEKYLVTPEKVKVNDPMFVLFQHHHDAVVADPPFWRGTGTSDLAKPLYDSMVNAVQAAMGQHKYAIAGPDSVKNIVVKATHEHQTH